MFDAQGHFAFSSSQPQKKSQTNKKTQPKLVNNNIENSSKQAFCACSLLQRFTVDFPSFHHYNLIWTFSTLPDLGNSTPNTKVKIQKLRMFSVTSVRREYCPLDRTRGFMLGQRRFTSPVQPLNIFRVEQMDQNRWDFKGNNAKNIFFTYWEKIVLLDCTKSVPPHEFVCTALFHTVGLLFSSCQQPWLTCITLG